MTKKEYLKNMDDKEFSLYIMKWVYQNYEIPKNYEPYSGKKIDDAWTPPEEPYDICHDNFDDYDRDDAIDMAVEELEMISDYWVEKSIDLKLAYLLDVRPKTVYENSIANIQRIMQEKNIDEEIINPMLFLQVISAMEQFLGSFFMSRIVQSDYLCRRFIENNKEIFEKVSLYEFSKTDKSLMEYCCLMKLNNVIWHRIDDVAEYYKTVLKINFPNDNGIIKGAIGKRHDLVHRNGRKKDGGIVKIGEKDLKSLINAVNNLVDTISKYNPFGLEGIY